MARIQILELPEGSSDDRPPFVLVVDQVAELEDYWSFTDNPERLGARAILVFEDTIDIPANDVPVDENGQPLFLKVHVEGEFEQFREQVQQEVLAAQGRITQALSETDAEHGRADQVREWADVRKVIATLSEERDEARTWARHGYEIGQKHCSWSDHGVAPAWLTEGWPPHIDSCEHLKVAAEFDTALTRVRSLHRPVEYRGTTICVECSAFAGSSTDNAPVAYDQCGTLRALNGDQPAPDA